MNREEQKERLFKTIVAYNTTPTAETLYALIAISASALRQGGQLAWDDIQDVCNDVFPLHTRQESTWHEIEL